MKRFLVIFLPLALHVFDAAAQLDSTRLAQLDSRLENYFVLLEAEDASTKSAECDALIEAATDQSLRQQVALKIYDHYLNSPLMGDEAVAIHLIDKWFSGGEIAMRSGVTTRYFTGNTSAGMYEYAWVTGNAPTGNSQPVGTRKPNNWGIYDFVGNAWNRLRDVDPTANLASLTDALRPNDAGNTVVKVAQAVKSQVEENLPGVKLNLQPMPKAEYFDRLTTNSFDIAILSWIPDYDDPMTFFSLWTTAGSEICEHWSNADYDKIIADCTTGNLAADYDARWAAMYDAEKILLENAVIAPLYTGVNAMLIGSNVSGIEFHVAGVNRVFKNVTVK